MTDLVQKTTDFIAAHREEHIDKIALKLSKQKELDSGFVLRQIEGWQKLRHKVPTWATTEGLHFPVRLSLEQCSSEATAVYKRNILCDYLERKGLSPQVLSFADLTGGLGVDFAFLAPRFATATYVEQNEALVTLAQHNLPLLGLPHAQIWHSRAEEVIERLPHCDVLLLDPARRDQHGRKTVALSDCSPDVQALQDQLWEKCRFLLLKLSPMINVHQVLQVLPHVAELHFVMGGNECKEVLLLADKAHEGETLHCVGDFRFTLAAEQAATPRYCSHPEGYLYEPHAAVMKSGGFKSFAIQWGLEKLHPHSHLYVSPLRHEGSPARCFRIEQIVGFSKAELKALSTLGRANLTVRNFPESVEQLRKRLRLKEGGEHYIFATTLVDERHVLLLCKKA